MTRPSPGEHGSPHHDHDHDHDATGRPAPISRQRPKSPELAIVIALVVVGSIGCGTTVSSSPSCSGPSASFAGHSYYDAGPVSGFQVVGRLGTQTFPPCDDTNSGHTLPPAERTIALYRVDGLDPEDGIAIRASGADAPTGFALLGRSDDGPGEFTPTFERFVDTHRHVAGPTGPVAPSTTAP